MSVTDRDTTEHDTTDADAPAPGPRERTISEIGRAHV